MPRGRRRKIVVPTGDTQPQFELGDTAEDMDRRRERKERDERERIEQDERDRERREESQEREESAN